MSLKDIKTVEDAKAALHAAVHEYRMHPDFLLMLAANPKVEEIYRQDAHKMFLTHFYYSELQSLLPFNLLGRVLFIGNYVERMLESPEYAGIVFVEAAKTWRRPGNQGHPHD
jgi:hypothetical protein